MTDRQVDVADLVDRMQSASLTLAVAESLTGGLIMARLTEVPGVGDVLRGGAVVYATDTKASELGVDADLLDARGPIDGDVAIEMAKGVRERWQADIGLATTGVAGPDRQDGHEVGEVFVAISGPSGDRVERPEIDSGATRSHIRQATVDAALALLDSVVRR
ncbi:MAG TPA: CinA family protein [Actinomycetes bacterium]|nr:CinA family protein [Actinomycetes bacterium]